MKSMIWKTEAEADKMLSMAVGEQSDAVKIRQELARILADGRFSEAPRISAFLRYVVERELAGERDVIKESVIGIEVYGRGEDYDPQVDSIVRVEASRLRSKLRDYYQSEGSQNPLRIELPKGTYVPRFTPHSEFPVSSPVPAAPTSIPAPAVAPAVASRFWIVVLAAAAVGFAGYFWMYLREVARPPSTASAPSSIAVLPLADLSERHDFEYFCDGLSEEIIDDLSRIPGLSVLARTSSFQFRGAAGDVREIGRKLGADRIVSGSVRRAGTRLRIMTQLVDVKSGYTIWSQTFDREAKDVLAVQDEISREVANALRVQSNVQEAGVHATNPEAYNLYLRGRYHYWRSTADDERRAAQYFEEAVARDPKFAAAHAGLADALASIPLRGQLIDRRTVERAREAAETARRLDPNLVDGLLAQAHIARTLDYNWAEAERLYRRAIELNPGAARPHNSYGVLLSLSGRFEDADREFHAAQKLDPLSLQVNTNLTLNAYRDRRYAEAVAQARHTIQIDPGYRNVYSPLAAALAEQEKYDEALAAIEDIRRRSGGQLVDNHLALLGNIYARAGRRQEALKVLSELEARGKERYVPKAALADVLLGLGAKDRALALMEQAAQAREILLAGLLVSPHADSVRSDPRFQALVAAQTNR